jgi:hypothetical protein
MLKLNASQATLASRFENIKLKLAFTSCNIKFNKTCLDHQLIPNYIKVKINNQSYAAKKAKRTAEISWIKNEIKFLYKKKSMLNTLLYKKHLELANGLHPSLFEKQISLIESRVSKKVFKKKKTQQTKSTKLMNYQKPREEILIFDFDFYPRVVNKTQIVFNDHEITLLNKGLKYNFSKNNKRSIFDELIAAESAIKFIPNVDDRNSLRAVVNNKMKNILKKCHPPKKTPHSHEQRTLKNIKEKLAHNNAIITKADKGNSIVIMYQTDYINKVNDFIESNDIIEIDKDPTTKFNLIINKAINNSKHLFQPEEVKYLKVMNPSAPTLRGLPKIHKQDTPIRPLVNFTTAPTYKIAKKLDRLLRLYFEFNSNHSLKNSLELVEKTKDLEIKSHHTLASFDIVNLYTNIPIKQTLEIIEKNLKNNPTLTTEARNELMNLLEITLQQNYFRFNEKFYSQPDGLAMGSPLSGILSEIYLNDIENNLILSDNNPSHEKILFYFRYVDDTLVLFDGNARQLQILNKYLNGLAPKLKFTLEIESNHKINFLDITIQKQDNKFKYSVYRKPTTTDQTIHASSYHPYSHKIAAYRSMVNRLIKLPLSAEEYSNELNIIKHIAISNGFETKMIDGLIKKLLTKNVQHANNTTIDSPQIKYVPIEYGHNLHNLLKKELKPFNIIPAPRTTNKIERILKPKPQIRTDELKKTGVYKLNCSDCDKYYLGQTGRSFMKRLKEHKPNPKINPQKSKYAQHLVDNNHSYESIENNLEIVEICGKGLILDTLEEFHIYKALKQENDKVLNEKLNYSSHLIFNQILETQTQRTNPSFTPHRTSPSQRAQSPTRSRTRRQCPPASARRRARDKN